MTYILKLSVLYSLLFVMHGNYTMKGGLSDFDKASFYAALAGKDVEQVNSLLAALEDSAIPEKLAYQGALLMKKAGLVAKPKEKLSLFKSGRGKLEAAIKNEEANTEFHFLRLIIQENSPKIVKYKSDLKSDSEIVRTSFKKLQPVVQQAVKDYSKKSAFLNPADF